MAFGRTCAACVGKSFVGKTFIITHYLAQPRQASIVPPLTRTFLFLGKFARQTGLLVGPEHTIGATILSSARGPASNRLQSLQLASNSPCDKQPFTATHSRQRFIDNNHRFVVAINDKQESSTLAITVKRRTYRSSHCRHCCRHRNIIINRCQQFSL